MEYSFVRDARDAGEHRRFGVWSNDTGMTQRTRIAAMMVLTAVAAAMVVWFWALRPLGFASYLTSPGASDADIVRQYWPNRLVQPEWVSPTPDRLMNWHLTETVAR
jgi:4-hydroxybenzoate polyprenyltransferase